MSRLVAARSISHDFGVADGPLQAIGAFQFPMRAVVARRLCKSRPFATVL